MRYHFDLDLGKFVIKPGLSSLLTRGESKRGDSRQVAVDFWRGPTKAALAGTPSEMVFIVKTGPAPDAVAVLKAEDWASAEEGHSWTAPLLAYQPALDEQIGDADFKDFKAELTFTDGNGGPTTSQTIQFRVANDLYKGTEGTPLEEDNPEEWLEGRRPLPLMLTDDPIRPATATITVTGNNTDSWSVTSPGVPDVGASSSPYGGDVAKAAYIANAINGEPLFPFLAWADTNVITLEAKASGEDGNGIAFGALGTGLVKSGPSLEDGHTEEAFVIGQSAIVEYTGGGSSEWVAIDTGSASNWMRRTATKKSLGIEKIDNTSDLAKPISTLTQAGLNLKGNLAGGNTWSGTNNFQGSSPIILKNGAGTTWGTFDSITGTLFLTKIETSVSNYLSGIITLAGTVSSNIYPTSNNVYSIGNTTNRFASAWFAGTVTMANAAISGTVSGNHSYSGQIELTGQAASNPTSAMTRFLSRVDDRNVMRYVMPCQAPTISGVSFAGTGGGANQSTSAQVGVVQCGVTNPGYATLRAAGYVNMTPGSRALVDFSRKFLMTSFAGSAYAGTTCEGRLFWPGINTYTTGGMTYKGFGWLQVGNLLYGQTHDGTTLRTTASGFTFPTTEYHHTAIYGDGAGNYSFYVNGSLLGTLAGPTGTQGLGGVASIILSAENKNAGDNMYVITNHLELSSWT